MLDARCWIRPLTPVRFRSSARGSPVSSRAKERGDGAEGSLGEKRSSLQLPADPSARSLRSLGRDDKSGGVLRRSGRGYRLGFRSPFLPCSLSPLLVSAKLKAEPDSPAYSAQPFARSTALCQPAMSSSTRAEGISGSKRRSTVHCAAISSTSLQNSTASPAR